MKAVLISFVIFIFLTVGFVIFWSNKNDAPINYPASEVLMTLKKKSSALQFCTYMNEQTQKKQIGLVIEDTLGAQIINLSQLSAQDSSATDSSNTVIGNSFLDISPETLKLLRKIEKTTEKNKPNNGNLRLKDAKLLAPFPEPIKVRTCVLSNGHQRNIKRKEFAAQHSSFANAAFYVPLNWLTKDNVYNKSDNVQTVNYYYSNHLGLNTSGSEIPTSGSSSLDIEPGLAIIIAKRGKDITIEEASGYIGGYCLFNDITDRSYYQKEKMSIFDFVKSKTANSMGPYFVTDLDPDRVAVEVYINDELAFSCSNEGLSKKIDELIVELSGKEDGLFPGEIVSIGAMNGGSLYELDKPLLQAGDEVKIIGNQGLGVLKNAFIN